MSAQSAIRQAIFGVSGVVLLSKFFGFVREMVIAERFGTSEAYDIFLIAVAAPTFFNLVVVMAINHLTVPFLTRQVQLDDPELRYRNIWSVYNSIFTIIAGLCLLIVLLAPQFVRLIGDNIQGEQFDMAVLYCRLASIMVMLSFHESFLRSALNVRKHFVYPGSGVIIFNLVVISVIYLLSGKLSVGAILLGYILGLFVQVIYLLAKLFNIKIIKYFNGSLFNDIVRGTLKIGGVIVTVELLQRLFFVIDRYFAAGLTEGVVSAMNYSTMLVLLPVSVIGFAVAAVTFPYLSERAGDDKHGEFSRLLNSSLSMTLIIGLPAGIFYFLFARDIAAAVFFRGAFDLVSLELTGNILTALGPYLIALFIYTILVQACYSAGLQKPVLMVIVVASILKIALTAWFIRLFDYPGLGWATSVVEVFIVLSLIVILKQKDRFRESASLMVLIGKLLIASIPILIIFYYFRGLPDYYTGMDLLGRFRVIWAGLIAIAGFVIIGYLINIRQLRETVRSIIRR